MKYAFPVCRMFDKIPGLQISLANVYGIVMIVDLWYDILRRQTKNDAQNVVHRLNGDGTALELGQAGGAVLKTLMKILTATVLCLMLVGLTFVITFSAVSQYYFGSASDGAAADVHRLSSKTAELYAYLEHYFIGDLDSEAVTEAACEAMVEATGDEWSYYISEEEYSAYLEQLQNAYVGVGITITQDADTGEITVTQVTENSPAEQAGVQVGDQIVGVNGQDISDMQIDELKGMVRGEEGSEITLDFVRNGESIHCTMTRQSIENVIVHTQLLESGDGYIKIDNFDGGCAEKTIAAIEDLQNRGAKSIIFDVRFNPGGLKDELIDLLDYLLPEGEIFHTVDYAGREEISTSDENYLNLPMAVLVNVDSYSAAEYFAAALQEYNAATIVGVQTYGKGHFQSALRMSDGSAVNLSIGEYFTPSGKNLAGIGITPDEVVELDDEALTQLYYGELEKDKDLQLQAAISALNPENT